MKKYQTLKNEIYDLASFPPEQGEIYQAVWNFYQQEPDWDQFTAFWLAQVDRLHPKLTRLEITETPLFKICEDLDSRLAIQQGYARRSDYRDELQMIIDKSSLLDMPSAGPLAWMKATSLGCSTSGGISLSKN